MSNLPYNLPNTIIPDIRIKPQCIFCDKRTDSVASYLYFDSLGLGYDRILIRFPDVNRPLDIADFKVMVNARNGELTVSSCPESQEPVDQQRSKKTGKINVHFKSEVCNACPSCERCPVKAGAKLATLNIDEAQYAGAARHHEYMGNAEYRKECGIRAGAESLMNELANAHDSRQSRHRTERGSRLQAVFAGIRCNVKRFIRFSTQNYVKNPLNVVI
jgi:hypothetical protein